MVIFSSRMRKDEGTQKPTSNKEVGNHLLKGNEGGSLGGSAVWRLPLAQGAILESRDRVLCRAPGMEPASPSCFSASMSIMNK